MFRAIACRVQIEGADAMSQRTLDTETTTVPTKFAHMVINTRQYEAMKRWYGDVLGMEIVVDNGMLCFLTFDDEHHRLALVNLPDLKEQSPELCRR